MTGRCIICNNLLHELIEFDNMPSSAQNIPSEEELPEDRAVSLKLCQCEFCGLVQFDVEPVFYYRDVIRAGGGTQTMKDLRKDEYARLLHKMKDLSTKGRRIVEVGCGRGEFLSMWDLVDEDTIKETGSEELVVCGIENNNDYVIQAKEKGLNVERKFADSDSISDFYRFDAFVQFNFLEHQPEPNRMLKCIYSSLNDRALGLVTVPSMEYILDNDGYYEFIRDHIAYFSFDSISYLFEKNGFAVIEKRIVNEDTIEIIVEKQSSIKTEAVPSFDGNYISVDSLGKNKEVIEEEINKYINKLDSNNATLAMWGAGHQGFTLASTTSLQKKIEYIIDSASFKQGRFAPASHIPIVSPDYFYQKPVDSILIVAPGYTDEIARTIREKYGDAVDILDVRRGIIEDYQK